jgi:sigma-B regulation protein RsbU (phosphoserine phosphatase)
LTRDEALALVGRWLAAANGHDAAAFREIYAEDAVAVSPVFSELRGRDAILASWELTFATIPDVAVEASEVLVEGDRLAYLGRLTATDHNGWFGLAPTGGVITYRVMVLCAVAGGRIVREERMYDSAGLLERLEKARLDQELRRAAEVQRALLPRTAHVCGPWESVGDSVPCRAIGGDFFELLDLPNGDLGIVLGDVSGNGAPAALVAAMLQGMLAADPQLGGPAATVARLNRRLAARHVGSRFATLVYAVLSPDGRLVAANAGHHPPVLLGRHGIRRLRGGGPVVGLFAEAAFEEETVQLEAGDTLVMFTDGVTEACNPDDEELGDERLLVCLREASSLPPADLLHRVFDTVREFCRGTEPADDVTVMVTRYR